MSTIDKHAIFAADDLRLEEVPVPEWPCGRIYIRIMTGIERDKWEGLVQKRSGVNGNINLIGVRALLVALTAVDQDGNRVFVEEDVDQLQKKNSAVLDRLAGVAMSANGIGDADLEDLKKSYPSTSSNGSGSTSLAQ